jgi:hypothetical protein
MCEMDEGRSAAAGRAEDTRLGQLARMWLREIVIALGISIFIILFLCQAAHFCVCIE